MRELARRRRRTHALVSMAALPTLAALRVMRTEQSPTRRTPLFADVASGLLDGAWVYAVTANATSIGRSLQNDVILLDPSASREHARLLREADGWWVENASSQSLLWIGPDEVAPAERARIHPGEALRLGAMAFQLVAPAVPILTNNDAAPRATDTEPTLELGATNLLSPGVTLQFALQGRFGPRARWALGVGALLIFLVSAVLTLGIAALIGRDALALGGAGRVLAALTVPLIPVLGAALLVLLLDRYEREPPLLLLGAFLWGAVIAIPPVLYLEKLLNGALANAFDGSGVGASFTQASSQALSAGVTEEIVKGAGLLLLLLALRDEFDNVTDGVLYGVLIGAGFALVENFVYFALSPHADLGVLVIGRIVLGWLGHSTFTAFLGAGLGYAREAHGRGRVWLPPLLGLLAAILLHTLFDFVALGAEIASASGAQASWLGVSSVLLDYVPLFGAQAFLLRVILSALQREAAIVRDYLTGEALAGVVTPDEYILVQNASLRDSAERSYGLTYGPRLYITARALYQTITGLAFRKWHVALGDAPKATQRQPEDAYRERIARLRRSLARQLAEHAQAQGQRAQWKTT